jgi:DNA-binding MarR family transcriptional regulator
VDREDGEDRAHRVDREEGEEGEDREDDGDREDRGDRGDREDGVDRIQRAWERERPGTPAGSIGVITRIWRIGKLLADERRRALARLGIDAATLDLLSTLRRAGQPYRLTAGAIAELSLVSAGAISQRVARAERAGLVRRERSAADGRLSYVTLTPAGHALIERSVDELLRHEEALLSGLTADQRADLSALLRILLADLRGR